MFWILVLNELDKPDDVNMIKCKLKSKLHELDGGLFISYKHILFIVLYETKYQIYIVIILFFTCEVCLEKGQWSKA